MQAFLPLRFEWLNKLPDLQSRTCLVEGIPDEYQSDEALKKFFADLYTPASVESAYVVKDCTKLDKLVAYQESLEFKSKESKTDELKKYYSDAAKEARKPCDEERDRIKSIMKTKG